MSTTGRTESFWDDPLRFVALMGWILSAFAVGGLLMLLPVWPWN